MMSGQDDAPFPAPRFSCSCPTSYPLLLGALRFPTPAGPCPGPTRAPGGGLLTLSPSREAQQLKLISYLHFWSQTVWICIQDLPHTNCAGCFIISLRLSPFDCFNVKMFLFYDVMVIVGGSVSPSVLTWTSEMYSLLLGKTESGQSISFGPLVKKEKQKYEYKESESSKEPMFQFPH